MNVRIGVIGPAEGDETALRVALDLLMADQAMRQIVYLGLDGAAERVVASSELDSLDEDHFLRQAAALAIDGTPDAIEALLAEDLAAQRLSLVRRLPDPPARAIEMLEKWIVLGVHDKAVLDEDDIANAHVIVYGKAKAPGLKRFGPRCFFTPGPLSAGCVGILELLADGNLAIRVLDMDGQVKLDEQVHGGTAKLVVTT